MFARPELFRNSAGISISAIPLSPPCAVKAESEIETVTRPCVEPVAVNSRKGSVRAAVANCCVVPVAVSCGARISRLANPPDCAVNESVTVTPRHTYLEVFTPAGTSSLRMQLSSRLRWDELAFDKTDAHYPPFLWNVKNPIVDAVAP